MRNVQLQNNEEVVPKLTFNGYSLFVEIDDLNLRARNRGVVMANILEEHISEETKRITPTGLRNILEYFNQIDAFERAQAYSAFRQILQERGRTSAS